MSGPRATHPRLKIADVSPRPVPPRHAAAKGL